MYRWAEGRHRGEWKCRRYGGQGAAWLDTAVCSHCTVWPCTRSRLGDTRQASTSLPLTTGHITASSRPGFTLLVAAFAAADWWCLLVVVVVAARAVAVLPAVTWHWAVAGWRPPLHRPPLHQRPPGGSRTGGSRTGGSRDRLDHTDLTRVRHCLTDWATVQIYRIQPLYRH